MASATLGPYSEQHLAILDGDQGEAAGQALWQPGLVQLLDVLDGASGSKIDELQLPPEILRTSPAPRREAVGILVAHGRRADRQHSALRRLSPPAIAKTAGESAEPCM